MIYLKNKNPKINNPLKGFKTKDLLITFVAILLFFFSGFGVGWFASSCSAKPLTAHADIGSSPIRGYNVRLSQLYPMSHNLYSGYGAEVTQSLGGFKLPRLLNGSRNIDNQFYVGGVSQKGYSSNSRDFVVFQGFFPIARPSSSSAFGNYSGDFGWNISLTNGTEGSGFAIAGSSIEILFGSGGVSRITSSDFDKEVGSDILVDISGAGIVPIIEPISVTYLDTSTFPLGSITSAGIYPTLSDVKRLSVNIYSEYSGATTVFFIISCEMRLYVGPNTNTLDSSQYLDLRFDGTYTLPIGSTFYTLPFGSFTFFSTDNGVLNLDDVTYQSGYTAGYSAGSSNGYDSGYNSGYTLGYDEGYNLGLSTSLDDISPFQVLSSGVTDFLQIEILPNVKLSLLLSVGFGLIILGFLLKFFLGG